MGSAAGNACPQDSCVETCTTVSGANDDLSERLQRLRASALSGELTGWGGTVDESAEYDTASSFNLAGARRRRDPDEELHQGSMRGDLRMVERALGLCADVSMKDSRGFDPLMLASTSLGKDSNKVVEALLAQKAESHNCDRQGWTALHHACRNGKPDALRLLTQAKGDPSQKTNDLKSCITLAVFENSSKIVEVLLAREDCRSLVAQKDLDHQTPLHYGAKSGNCEICRLLIAAAAKVNVRDIDGRTPLSWACERGKLECMKTLHKAMADLDAIDKRRRTPIFYTVENCYEGAGVWLLKRGADPFCRDERGETPEAIADDNGLPEFKRVLKAIHKSVDDDDRI